MDYSALLIPTITIIIILAVSLDLTRTRFKTTKMLVILGIVLTLQIAVNGALLLIGGLNCYAKWHLLSINIPAILTIFYLTKRRGVREMFTFLTANFIGASISIPSIWISGCFEYSYGVYNFARLVIFAVLFLVIHKILRPRYLLIQEEITKGWGIFSILPGISTLVLYYEYYNYGRTRNFYEFLIVNTIITFFMVTDFIVFFYVFTQLHFKYIVQEEKRILSMQNKSQWNQFMQQKELNEKTNRRWHDLRHHTEELIGFLESGDIATALGYLKEQRSMDMVSIERYCLHPAVNSILCLWAERARREGILVEILTDVPEKLMIEPMELSALFANAFENAYNGCMQLPQTFSRGIKVEANYNGKKLAIGFRNSCKNDIVFEGGMPISPKEGGGIGTRSIIYTVKRFSGVSCFEAKEGVFSARFVLTV